MNQNRYVYLTDALVSLVCPSYPIKYPRPKEDWLQLPNNKSKEKSSQSAENTRHFNIKLVYCLDSQVKFWRSVRFLNSFSTVRTEVLQPMRHAVCRWLKSQGQMWLPKDSLHHLCAWPYSCSEATPPRTPKTGVPQEENDVCGSVCVCSSMEIMELGRPVQNIAMPSYLFNSHQYRKCKRLPQEF